MQEDGGPVEHADPEVSMGGAAYLPELYVSDSGQKLHLYRRLSKIRHQSEVDDLRRELEDRYGRPPPEVERLLDQVLLRILGRDLGIERILLRDRGARVNFRPDVVPKLAALERPFRDRQVQVEVRRMAPLSLELTRLGPEPLAPTLIRALAALGQKARAA
jgi:transcription-repair coupling factor (superfamily II helicase)